MSRAEIEISWPYLRYYQTDVSWQREKCALLGVLFKRANNFEKGGPNVTLNRPNLRTQLRAIGDGNCLFRCLSQIITGSPDQHYEVRMCIIGHMRHIAHLLIAYDGTSVGDDVEAYICATKMDQLGSYGTDNDMLTLSHLLECNIYSYHPVALRWSYMANPGHIDTSIPLTNDRKSMYLYWENQNHFNIVTSQLNE